MVVPEFRGFPFIVTGTDRFYVISGKKRYLDFSGSAMTTGYDFLTKDEYVSPVSTLVFKNTWNTKLTHILQNLSTMEDVVYCTSGTEACETALSRYNKPIFALENAYHGRGFLTYKASNGDGIDDRFRIVHLKVPSDQKFEEDIIDYNNKLAYEASRHFDIEGSTLIIELVQSDGGINVLTDSFIRSLIKLKEQYMMHLIIDEVYTGMGRSGELLLSRKKNLKPDMICIGKGMAAGFPLSAVLYGGKWAISFNGAYGMAAGNMFSSRAAVKTISGLTEKKLDFVRKQGIDIIKRFAVINNKNISSVRGIGFMIGVEFSRNRVPLTKYAYFIRNKLIRRGITCSLVGADNNILKITPPPYIDKDTLNRGINIIGEILGE